jgi:diguanylate cyclase
MLKDLFANAAILMAFLFMAGELIKIKRLQLYYHKHRSILGGLSAGMLGIILMIYSVSAPYNVIIDLRQFALIVIAMHGGFFPTVIAGIIMSAFRILYFGNNFSSVFGAILILFISIVCGILSKLKAAEYKRWIYMNAVSILAFSIFFAITLADPRLILHTLLYYWIITVVVAFIVTYLSKHIVLSNSLYQKYRTESMKDFLTGLDNVRRFDTLLNHISNSLSEGQTVSLLMLDIDYFKKINDTYGHSTGDEVLKELSGLISDNCMQADSVSRVGGEEFCIILRDHNASMALGIAEQIRSSVEQSRFTPHHIKMTISIGVAVFPETVMSLENLIEEADKALYFSKRSGRNKVSLNK